MKKIALLGSTGSIGTQTLEVVREQGDIQVVAMAVGKIFVFWNSRYGNFSRNLYLSGKKKMPALCGKVCGIWKCR